MLKNKPLLIIAIIFGGIGAIILIFAAILLIDGGKEPLDFINSVLGMPKGKVTVATISQFALVFEVMSFIVGYNAIKYESE